MQRAQDEKLKQLVTMLEGMSSLMMTTSPTGTLSQATARPMSVAKVGADCTVYFLTSAETTQIADLEEEQFGMCTGQTTTQHLSLLGTFNVTRDRARIDELWSKMAEAWFPKGPSDPRIRVIEFHPSTAEFWDMSGAKGISYFIDVAKSWITKEPPPASPETHTKIDLPT